jgi:TonB family protein
MLRNILILVLSFALLQTARAETPDTLVNYFNNAGKKVITKDSADYYRIILPPDTDADKDLYRVFDYYLNGKIKMLATSLTKDVSLVFDGACISYFPNGKRSSTAQFKNGRFVGLITNYYPNGKLFNILKVKDLSSRYYGYYNRYSPSTGIGYTVEVVELRDSTGNILALNGTGHVVAFDEDFKKVLREGDIKNNKKEGEWRGIIADTARYICFFHKDDLKSGESFTNSGKHYTFKQIEVKAVFSDGNEAFYSFIKKNLQYPETARKHDVKGTVMVGFYVETNGTISDVKVVRGLFKSLDDEAVRVISLSPLWIPASEFGIPMRTYYTAPVDFFGQ